MINKNEDKAYYDLSILSSYTISKIRWLSGLEKRYSLMVVYFMQKEDIDKVFI